MISCFSDIRGKSYFNIADRNPLILHIQTYTQTTQA